mgnify:CR=1 FL=1
MIQTTSQTVFDGERNAVMQFTGVSDGTGQETNVVKVSVSSLTNPCRRVAIKRIEYNISGGIVRLLWDDNDPIEFLDLSDLGNDLNYKNIMGLQNIASNSASGDVLFSTIGFDVGSAYTIKLDLIKKY